MVLKSRISKCLFYHVSTNEVNKGHSIERKVEEEKDDEGGEPSRKTQKSMFSRKT
jgi:hypothetical protein